MKSITSFKKEFEFLNNFYPAPFTWDNEVWPTVEHAYQAAKTTSDYNRRKIKGAKTPGIAKYTGKCITLREDWEEVKVLIMTELVWEKFDQDDGLRKRLLDTGSAELVEGNYWHDNFWGDCFCKKCTDIEGKNMLGCILV